MIELCDATEDNPFIHGMSKQFVKALKQLFDVMDTDRSGTIKYSELATQWEEDLSDPFFPKGLIICLAKVTLPNGLLTFDRFCAGIKLCLLKNQVELKEVNEEHRLVNHLVRNEHENKLDNALPTERPSSEPKIFAPPPPQSSLNNVETPKEINNNISICNKNISFHSFPSFNSLSANNNSVISEIDQISSKNKKLPLPSYEQVMAAKSRSNSKLPVDYVTNIKQSIENSHDSTIINANISQSNNITDDIRRANLNLYENFSNLPIEIMSHYLENFPFRTKSLSHLENFTPQASNQPDSPQINDPTTKTNNSELFSTTNKTNKFDQKLTTSASYNHSNIQPKTYSRNCILKTLQNWRDHILNKQVDTLEAKIPIDNELVKTNSQENSIEITNPLNASSLRRNVPKKREPRRHTVGANGIDLYTVCASFQISMSIIIK